MTAIRSLTLAAFAALTLSAAAFAQQPMMMEDNSAMMMGDDGRMMMMQEPMTDAMMTMARQNAQEVPDNTIFFMNDGKLYMAQDMKMEDGTMMSEGMEGMMMAPQ